MRLPVFARVWLVYCFVLSVLVSDCVVCDSEPTAIDEQVELQQKKITTHEEGLPPLDFSYIVVEYVF